MGLSMASNRKEMLPSYFESQLLLYVYREFWGIDDVK